MFVNIPNISYEWVIPANIISKCTKKQWCDDFNIYQPVLYLKYACNIRGK